MATECEAPPSINNNTAYESQANDHLPVHQPVSRQEDEANDHHPVHQMVSRQEDDGDVSPAQSGSETTTTTESQSPQPPDSLPGLSSPVKATMNTILSSPLSPGSLPPPVAAAVPLSKPFTVKAFKDWGLTTLKCTKQKVMERLGHGTKTIDSELELQIEVLRDTHAKYQVILRQVRALSSNFMAVVQSQRDITDTFCDLSQKMPELHQEFACNAETQKTMFKSGEMLVGALEFFTSNLGTLCDKTIEDTLLTVKQYETARVEYDAFRTDFETQQQMVLKDPVKLEEAQQKFDLHREKFDRMRSDLNIKMKLLDENKIKVMRRQLVLLQDAIAVYLSGNHLLVEEAMTRFNISLAMSNAEKPSWLESTE